MARRVKTTSGVRECIRDLGVKQICEDLNMLSQFRNAISRTISGWGEFLSRDLCDEMIVIQIAKVLEDWDSIENELHERMELPDGWGHDDANWERYRSALAVTTLQAYYDSIG